MENTIGTAFVVMGSAISPDGFGLVLKVFTGHNSEVRALTFAKEQRESGLWPYTAVEVADLDYV